MPRVTTTDPLEYAESDGRPMGETDAHRDWMIRLLDIFRCRYRNQQVYVAGDLLVYYEEGNPRRFVVPDLFVVKNCDPSQRRTFKIWEEDRTPNFVIEVTSRSSRREDEQSKPQIYSQIGVEEYILYDPTGEYLSPPLQGFRLDDEGSYQRIPAGTQNEILCPSLDVTFQLNDGQLVVQDSRTGAILRTLAETALSAYEQERAAREAAQAARQAAEARAVEMEAELQRLRKQLESRRDERDESSA